jgi:hypothetical protein
MTSKGNALEMKSVGHPKIVDHTYLDLVDITDGMVKFHRPSLFGVDLASDW